MPIFYAGQGCRTPSEYAITWMFWLNPKDKSEARMPNAFGLCYNKRIIG